jgi:SOS-response transcriptional repressor LexA
MEDKYMVGKRIKELRDKFKLTQEGFGLKIGVKQGNVADWERGRSSPALEAMQNIVKVYNVNLNWLLTGNGPMFLPLVVSEPLQKEIKQKVFDFVRNELNLLEEETPSHSENGDFWYLPLQGEIAAGSPLPFNFDSDPIKHIPIAKSQLPNPNICDVFRVNGDSMEPKIEHSDIVVIRREQDWWLCDNKVIAVRTPDGLTLKKLVVDFVNNSACLIPFNPKYKIMFMEEECQIIGYLIFLIRQC